MGSGGSARRAGQWGLPWREPHQSLRNFSRPPLLFLHFSLPPLSPPLQLQASSFSGVGWGHAPDGEGVGEGVVNWGVGDSWGWKPRDCWAKGPPLDSEALWWPGVPKACSERKGSATLRLSHFGICNSRQQRGWGQRRGDMFLGGGGAGSRMRAGAWTV